jgi:hypothetical protein
MALPPELREALEREIDPGERLRWCGQPDPRQIWRGLLRPFFAMGSFFAALSGAFAFIAISTWLDVETLRRPGQEAPPVGFLLAVSLALLAPAGWLWGQPWVERFRAGRTVFALTNTRVFVLEVRRDGRVNLHAFEPTHPLAISRVEHRGGSGTLWLNAGDQVPGRGATPRAVLALDGVREPRTVERLIRQTFDPPGVK